MLAPCVETASVTVGNIVGIVPTVLAARLSAVRTTRASSSVGTTGVTTARLAARVLATVPAAAAWCAALVRVWSVATASATNPPRTVRRARRTVAAPHCANVNRVCASSTAAMVSATMARIARVRTVPVVRGSAAKQMVCAVHGVATLSVN